MVTKWRAFGVALALTLGVGFAWAQQSTIGGSSSRPRFQSVGVGASASTSHAITAHTSATSLSAFVWCANGLAANGRCWQLRTGTAGDAQLNALNDDGSTASAVFSLTRAGVLSVNGAPIPKFARGVILETGGTCTVSQSSGIASVSYAAVAGRCNITLNAGFTTNPVCTATPTSGSTVKLSLIDCASATACTLYQRSDFTTVASGASNVVCMGS